MGRLFWFVPRWAELVSEQGGNVSPVCLRYTAVHRGLGWIPKVLRATAAPEHGERTDPSPPFQAASCLPTHLVCSSCSRDEAFYSGEV